MKHILPIFMIGITLSALTVFYYFIDFTIEIDKIFLSTSTFLFSIFTGFFISRQASRFNKVRETVTAFDGKMSSIYRASGHIGPEIQTDIGTVIANHYNKILKSGKWHVHFTEKSTTISDLHNLLEEQIEEKKVTKLSNQAIGAIVKGLVTCQDIRKQMVALYEERIPREQWILILFFACILISTVSIIDSYLFPFAALLKAAFVVSVLSVLLILYKLNNLIFSENIMGQHSAEDVLGIIDQTK